MGVPSAASRQEAQRILDVVDRNRGMTAFFGRIDMISKDIREKIAQKIGRLDKPMAGIENYHAGSPQTAGMLISEISYLKGVIQNFDDMAEFWRSERYEIQMGLQNPHASNFADVHVSGARSSLIGLFSLLKLVEQNDCFANSHRQLARVAFDSLAGDLNQIGRDFSHFLVSLLPARTKEEITGYNRAATEPQKASPRPLWVRDVIPGGKNFADASAAATGGSRPERAKTSLVVVTPGWTSPDSGVN